MLHKSGNEFSFFIQMAGQSDYGMDIAEQLWNKSPHKEDEEND